MLTTSLEQSKKLKELGAPQDTILCFSERGVTWFKEDIVSHPVIVKCAAYTLQELIEWLGDDFTSLDSGGEIQEKKVSRYYVATGKRGYFGGITPLEAVYNLAVAIKSNPTGGKK